MSDSRWFAAPWQRAAYAPPLDRLPCEATYSRTLPFSVLRTQTHRGPDANASMPLWRSRPGIEMAWIQTQDSVPARNERGLGRGEGGYARPPRILTHPTHSHTRASCHVGRV